MNITNKYTIDIETKANGFLSRPLQIVLKQDFDVIYTRQGVDWTEDGDIVVSVMAGNFEIFNGGACDLGGWMRLEVLLAIDKGIDWDIKDADALEMLRNAQDQEAHEREHAAGRI